jgi:AmmeMemoRadiSam system protein A
MVADELTRDDRRALLALARAAVAHAVSLVPEEDLPQHPVYDRGGGAFVTLHVRGELRGCVGNPDAFSPLGDVIVRCAAAAAREDPRFPHITAADWPALSIEISVLSPLTRCDDPETLVIGRHGVAVEHGSRRGLLLPQVAVAHRWSVPTFLAHTCGKAGLPPDAWRCGAVIYSFEADVFDEPEHAPVASPDGGPTVP